NQFQVNWTLDFRSDARPRSEYGAATGVGLASRGGRSSMPFVTSHMSISLDGFVAGRDQSEDNPLGVDGIKLHRWHLNDPKHQVDEAFTQRLLGPRGAYI